MSERFRLQDVIVVEGEHDRQAIDRAVEADCVITYGHALKPELIERLRLLQERRGLIIFTDPDHTGERIRRTLAEKIPGVRHAHLPRSQALAKGDIGIENASPEAIRRALSQVQTPAEPRAADAGEAEAFQPISWSCFLSWGLTGRPESVERRRILGERLGIGFANARTFWQRLNSYRVPLAQIEEAVAALRAEEARNAAHSSGREDEHEDEPEEGRSEGRDD